MGRWSDRDTETAAGWPTSHSMIVQLREAVGLFAGAMPISPQQAWEEAVAEVRNLRTTLTDLLLTRQEYELAYAADVRLDDGPDADYLTCHESYERVKAAELAHEAAWQRARDLKVGRETG